MSPEPGQVLHFSEDPSIKTFAPHVAATAQQPDAVAASSLGFSGIRLRNARPRTEG